MSQTVTLKETPHKNCVTDCNLTPQYFAIVAKIICDCPQNLRLSSYWMFFVNSFMFHFIVVHSHFGIETK